MEQPITERRGHREPWNKGKLVGQKAPLKLKEIWAIRVRLELGRRIRDLALFNLAIDSKLRSCDLVKVRVRAIAKKDGVVMVNFFPAFIDEAWRSAWNEQRSERMTAYQALEAEFHAKKLPVPYFEFLKIDQTFARAFPRAPLSSLIDHFDHAIRVAGIDHVGFGTDFDGFATLPEGIDSASDLPKVSTALLERGHSEDDLRKLLGGNLLRVFGEVERLSKSNT